jgi:hypothetical protein
MCYVHGSVVLLLACMATVDAQVKCNRVSFTVTGGSCKDKTVSYNGCFDATKLDADATSKAAFINTNQALFAPHSKEVCLSRAKVICALAGGTVKASYCNDVNDECAADNLANNNGVGACTTDAHCTGFAKSKMMICCDILKKYTSDLICDNTDKKKIDAFIIDGNNLCVHTQFRCGSNLHICPHTTIFLLVYLSIHVS